MELNKLHYYGDFNTTFIPHIFKEIYFDHIYDEVLQKAIFCGKEKNTVNIIDVGANIGLTAMYFSNFGIVYAIEPEINIFTALRCNTINLTNILTYNVAITDESKRVKIYSHKNNSTMNSLLWETDQYKEVQGLSIEDFINTNTFNYNIDLFKLDVEGAEHLILNSEGFRNVSDRILNMIIEFHAFDEQMQNTLKYLQELDYNIKQVQSDAIIFQFEKK